MGSSGIFGPLVLSILMGFVPMLLSLIVEGCFTMNSENEVQLFLQKWYGAFMFVFILLVSALGDSLFVTTMNILSHPLMIFQLLATSLPYFCTFYCNYMLVQTGVDAMAMLRLSNLLKYNGFYTMYGAEEAKKRSEPEDPISFGMGVRSARVSMLLCIALVFVNLNPLICMLAILNFVVMRVVYPYLFMYAERSKQDLGGMFWCAQMQDLQFSVAFYVVLMVSELYDSTKSLYFSGAAAASLVYWWHAKRKYQRHFHVEVLDLSQVEEEQDQVDYQAKNSGISAYRQTELFPEEEEEEKAQGGKKDATGEAAKKKKKGHVSLTGANFFGLF